MPNSKTTLRIALAAVAVPGVVVGVAAPAASAAELTPAAHQVDSRVDQARHASLSDMQSPAQVGHNEINGHDIDLGLR